MTDVFSKQKRHEVMAKIRSRNTKLDLTMKKTLKKSKIPYLMYPKIYGNPDFLINDKIALFCDSSFWHGKNWTELKKKLGNGNNPEYWVNHISKNRQRDRQVTRKLKNDGYKVIRFWDDEIYKNQDSCISKIMNSL